MDCMDGFLWNPAALSRRISRLSLEKVFSSASSPGSPSSSSPILSTSMASRTMSSSPSPAEPLAAPWSPREAPEPRWLRGSERFGGISSSQPSLVIRIPNITAFLSNIAECWSRYCSTLVTRLEMLATPSCMVFMSSCVGGPFTLKTPCAKVGKLKESVPEGSRISNNIPGSSTGTSIRVRVCCTVGSLKISTNSERSKVPLPSASASSKRRRMLSSSCRSCRCMRRSCNSWFCFAAFRVFSTMTPTMMFKMPKVVKKRKSRKTMKKSG
mmetsp:Transcript_8227/g.14138  ORF Transcript_8227/g.14138 Transcript_8227/m.14138 type:complete len:269 (+) Transcript_8227:166-972(+)